MLKKFKGLNERGQGLVEYALLIVLIAMVVIIVLVAVGRPALTDIYCKIVASVLDAASFPPPAICAGP